MSSKASMDDLDSLHGLIIRSLTEIVSEGVPLMAGGEPVMEDGRIVRVPAAPAYYAQAVKILNDNDITAVLTPDSPLAGLIRSLPTFTDEEGELPTATHPTGTA